MLKKHSGQYLQAVLFRCWVFNMSLCGLWEHFMVPECVTQVLSVVVCAGLWDHVTVPYLPSPRHEALRLQALEL